MAKKYVYSFGKGTAEGNAGMRNLLGGKGANLAEMSRIKLPVPSGFTITTECCTDYFAGGAKFPKSLEAEVKEAMIKVEKNMGMKFGDPKNPLLISSRSGARQSMPGMMETVLNIGLSSKTIPGLIAKTKNEKFVYDSYRRLITMYADVVMEKAEGIEPADDNGIRRILDGMLDKVKKQNGYKSDTELTVEDLKVLCADFKKKIKEVLKKEFPDDAWKQLWGGIAAVMKSWNGKRALAYRRIEGIPDSWGTAVNIQAMVFGNIGDTSATGVAFSRNPATGENKFYGEWLVNAQGEDVVSGIRTPSPLNKATKNEQNKNLKSLEEIYPAIYKQLVDIKNKLEKHYKDMQDIEFTIQEGKLYMLQCRNGKRTGNAALNMAIDMLAEKLIDEKTVITRVEPAHLSQLLLPFVDPDMEKKAPVIVRGLPAGPGGAAGRIIFTSEDAVKWNAKGEKVILVREETNPEDIEGMKAAQGILTARGGMTSHAALVARGWGKCCIVGAGSIQVNIKEKKMVIEGKIFREGDWLTLNGSKGLVYEGKLSMKSSSENPKFKKFMSLVDKYRVLGIRTNADSPEDAKKAVEFGAEGIGLLRAEHMFYGKDSAEPLKYLRKMILSSTEEERNKALEDLYPYMKKTFKKTLEVMEGRPVTIRLLDPPLHEFVPKEEKLIKELAEELKIDAADIKKRGETLHENNPMMGHRGVRLGITYPEITAAQVKAIFESAVEINKAGKKKCKPEIMIPVTCDANEIVNQKAIIKRVHSEVCKSFKITAASLPYMVGTMIEIPRACLMADEFAKEAEFFSFGTNDLTQMGFGFSRDDIGSFLPDYLEKKVLENDPFQTIDQKGIGQLIETAVKKGRSVSEKLKIGICGEQGGDPASVQFCHRTGLDYVSCSPYRVPIARLAAAQAAIEFPLKKAPAKKASAKTKK